MSAAPGPWSTDGKVLRDASGHSIASGGNNRMMVTGDTLDASLRIAAAAPDMLEALVFIRDTLNFKRKPSFGVKANNEARAYFGEKIRDAILKATGDNTLIDPNQGK